MVSALTWNEFANAAETPVRIAFLVVLGILARLVLHRVIDRLVAKTAGLTPPRQFFGRAARIVGNTSSLYQERRTQRAQALGSLFKSITTAATGAVVVLMILGQLNFDLAPILASAGVVGLAVGFGAQNLVKDFLSGVFMLMEDQYGVGDVVDMGEAVGTVESVGLRVTRIRDGDGVLWHIRNGEVIRVGNKSQGWSSLLLDIEVAYDQDIAHVERLVNDTAQALAGEEKWRDKIIETPEVVGIEQANGQSITLRVIGKCLPNEQYGVARELRLRIKSVFDTHGVRLPVPAWPSQPAGGPTA
jgi:small conductance mechanosensitive channel